MVFKGKAVFHSREIREMQNTNHSCGHVLLATAVEQRSLAEQRDTVQKRCDDLKRQLVESSGRWVESFTGSTRAELQRQFEIEQTRLSEMQSALNHLRVVEPATDASVVAIGVNVTIQRYDADGNTCGKPETFYVGGYGSTDTKTVPPTVSYDSIILRPLMGKGIDGSRDWEAIRLGNGKLQYIELIALSLPAARQAQNAQPVADSTATRRSG